jgi:2-dehydro-3-deoxyphosphogluconate aldolase/(4S)-4-hydroxy-2-oxoglutarate aldolase
VTRRETVVREIGRRRVSAIIRTKDASLAREAMAAAVRGGFRIVEFTLTTPSALELIQEFSANDDLLVGAGTVLTTRQAADAVRSGASFLVSPVVDPEVISEAARLDAASIPGCFTPTEMQAADAAGADLVKVFPSPADIATYVRQVRGPLPHLKMFPTAGVDEENFQSVLAAGAYGVGFVSSLFPPDELERKDFARIEARAARVMSAQPLPLDSA